MAKLITSMMATEGLFVYRGFLNVAERQGALRAAIALSGQAQEEAARSTKRESTSSAHNVNQAEKFKSVSVPLENGKTAVCEHFSQYGEGHRLTYFRGEIPSPGVPTLLDRLADLDPLQDEVASSRQRLQKNMDAAWKWKLTLNHYPPAGGATVPRKGFPWHRDLIANGAATMILNLGAPGGLEFGEEPPTETPVDGMRYSTPQQQGQGQGQADHSVAPGDAIDALESLTLTDGDLLLLTGRARWEYLHRVVPTAGGGERATLVYGVW